MAVWQYSIIFKQTNYSSMITPRYFYIESWKIGFLSAEKIFLKNS